MNPFLILPKKDKINYYTWEEINVKPYDKKEVSPYTKTRVILMNGTEFESIWFLHQFNRNCLNNNIRRKIAMVRRQEQQQQKLLSSLKPINESMLETTIAYEQLAVDLTAEMAIKEDNPFVKEQLNFALLEDFDHLYRYSNLLDMEEGIDAKTLVGGYTEITPGRPTVSEHRHPNDDVRHYINDWRDSLLTRLHTHIITAAEQQTMNYYLNIANFYPTQQGRELYTEIAMIEEQHVTGYGSLMDPSCTWLENWVFHEYTECYLYYSCYSDESDSKIKNIWKTLYEQELTHLKIASDALKEYEGRTYQQLFPTEDFPSLIKLKENIEYVRKVMSNVRLTGEKEGYKKIDLLNDDADFFAYQNQINKNVNNLASHKVIKNYIEKNGQDYRFEVRPNAEKTLRDRKNDNVELGRVKGK